jgi:hypothetical protein
MAGMHSSAYAPPLNYNQPTEVVGGYDAQINPMTGQEIPQTNFAGGGLASLLESKGRRGDTMLVHMNPEEVQGLQALAMAHGGSLTINPETGLYEASFLKKLLPTIIGATLNTFAPGVGSKVGSLFGLSGAAASTIGTGLVVGGAYGLIEGDLKKGLQAGLGAYSGANIAQSLQAASMAAPGKLAPEQLDELRRTTEAAKSRAELAGLGESSVSLAMPKGAPIGADLQVKSLMNPSMTRSEVIPSYGSLSAPRSTSLAEISKYMPSVDVITGTGPVAPAAQPSIMGGIKGLFTSPESRTAFGQAMGGGFKSPFMQNIAKTVTYGGLADAFTPAPKKLPTGGAGSEDIVYIPGGFNPLYGTGRDQPYQLPGKYYKKTARGLVPFNPFAMAPGYAEGGEIEGYADGGEVGVAPPRDPMFAQLGVDPNVAATRAYIEDLNRRARNPVVSAYPGTGGGFYGTPFDPSNFPSTPGGGGGGVGGGGSLTGSPAGDLIAGIGGQYLAQKGIEKGIGYLKDKFTTGPEDLQEVEVTGKRVGEPPTSTDLVPAAASVLPAAVSPFAPELAGSPGFSVDVQTGVDASGEPIFEKPGEPPVTQPSAPSSVASLAPAALSVAPAAASGLASLAGAGAGGVSVNAAGEVVVSASKEAAKAAWNAAYDKAIASGLGEEAAGKVADAAAAGGPMGKIIPGLQAALGLHQTYEGIRKGNEVQSALGAFGATSGLAGLGLLGASAPAALGGASMATLAGFGPVGLAAAAIAALGASLVNTKEFGDKALENYWKAVDQGRGFGSAPPEELAQGFINFYRTNKNEFPGQAKYGRKGNEDFIYDMTQVINKAVKDGTVDKGADAATIFEKAVQPWLNTMGEGPKNKDARRIQNFMMTDLIHNFMYGQPISNAQVKGNKNFKIVSERPVYAGAPPEINKYSLYNVATTAPELTYGGSRISSNVTPEDSGPGAAYRAAQLQQTAGPPPTPFSEPRELAPVSTPYSPRIIEEEAAPPMPPAQSKMAGLPALVPVEEERAYIPRRQEEEPVYMPPAYTPPMVYESPYASPSPVYEQTPYIPPVEEEQVFIPRPQLTEEVPIEAEQPYIPRRRELDFMSPFSEVDEGVIPFNYGGAVGEDYNFGFARGGMPGEYAAGGKLLDGPGDGMSDDIPAVIRGKGVQRAALADGEFVIPADVVSHLGNGSTKAGAKKLYDMMARVRQARTGKTKQAPAVKTGRLLPA